MKSKIVDFIQADAVSMQTVKDLVVNQGLTINGQEWKNKVRPSNAQIESKFDEATEEDMVAILELCGHSADDIDAPARIADDEIVIDMSAQDTAEIDTANDGKVEVVFAEYIGESNKGFKFRTKSGLVIVARAHDLELLSEYGGLTDGYRMPFKPQSIRPLAYGGFFNGVPNYSADERLQKILETTKKNQKNQRRYIAKIRKSGLSRAEQDKAIQAEIVGSIPKPKYETPKF